MSRSQWMARGLGIAGAILLVSWMSASVWSQWRLEYQHPSPNSVVPNSKEFGHFKPQWRHWPGEERLDEVNPRAVPANVLPTPEGQEIVPPPKITAQALFI